MAEGARPFASQLSRPSGLGGAALSTPALSTSVISPSSRTTTTSTITKSLSLQLDATKKQNRLFNQGELASTGGGSSSLAEQLEQEAAADMGGKNTWEEEGEDLMDVNADADDWSEFVGDTVDRDDEVFWRSTGAFQSAPPASVLDDAWGDSLDQDSAEPTPTVSRTLSPLPPPTVTLPRATAPQNAPSLRVNMMSTAVSDLPKIQPTANSTDTPGKSTLPKAPAPSLPIPGGWEYNSADFDSPSSSTISSAPSTAPGSMAGMSKEEKMAEMARRREERKQVH
jgi:hypothetical protein